jgi:hypothetical protein
MALVCRARTAIVLLTGDEAVARGKAVEPSVELSIPPSQRLQTFVAQVVTGRGTRQLVWEK